MELIKKFENGKMEIQVKGRLDSTTSIELENVLKESLPNTEEITFDFSQLDYISSAGLRVLLTSQRTMNKKEGKMFVKHINETIKEIFEVTGFTDILTII